MKLVVQTKLLPSPAQAEALAATLAACNAAANWVSRVGWEEQCFANRILRGKAYRQLKEQYGLSAQPAQHVIKKVADAYKVNRTKRRSFRGDAAQPFDDRCLSWQVAAGTVSIWTIHGRIKGIRFTCGRRQQDLLASRRGESDLLIRDGCWYLLATCDVPEATMSMPTSMIGVDLGITNIATTSDGTRLSGKQMNRVRHRNRQLRSKLQRKGTKGSPLDYLAGATVTDLRGFVLVRKRCCAGTPKGAKRLLRKRRRREARFVTDINHGISKWIVAEAQRTGRGISLEALQGIRRRVRLRAPQRAALHSWSFHQLGTFIDYKARRAGVLTVFIDPAYTSQTCSACGHVDRRSRINQSTFKCRRCGFAEHADVNAAVNLSVSGWAVVNQPDADMPLAASEAV